MNQLWEIYENMQEYVYVTDIDSYEVIYANRYARERLGVQSVEELKGQKCFLAIRKCESRCSICTNDRLKPGTFHEWRYYDGIQGKTFLMKDTVVVQDGRRYRLEIAIDIGETDIQKKTIKEFTSNEAMVNEALRRALAEPTPDKSIQVLLKHLGQSLRGDRVYIFEDTQAHTLKNTYEWCAAGVEPQIEYLQEVPFDVTALWYDAFKRNENIVIKSLESIRESDPKVYETLLPQQVDSLVVSPLVIDDRIIGFYGVDNPPKEFLNHISVMFMVLGYFIASILRRRNLVDHLEKMSYFDQLTGALNRHGMNEFVANVDQNASIGLLYCDVMGLKQINDTQGHLAGDALLIRAYECLCNAFSSDCVFRIGGDEFLVMNSNVTKEFMDSRAQLLRDTMTDYRVQFAIGTVYEEKCNGQIAELLKAADKAMYDDKRHYYSMHPNNRRSSDRRQ